MDTEILQRCILFRSLQGDDLQYALAFFQSHERTFDRGEYIHRPGTRMNEFGLLLSGHIQVFMDDFDGNRMIMANVVPGSTFGESLCFLGSETQVYIESVSESRVLCMNTASLNDGKAFSSPLDRELCRRFTAMLAERTLHLNDRIQILSKLTIKEKVITLLSQQASLNGKVKFQIPFSRESMATYLGVNQNALSRVLSQMAREKIIRFKGNEFEII